MRLHRRWDRDVRRAMKGVPNVRVVVSASRVAAALWDFGEDDLAERALVMGDADLQAVRRICAVYREPAYPLPHEGRITNRHVDAFAAVAYFEGSIRPLARSRRRPEKDRPAHLQPTSSDPWAALDLDDA